MCSRFPEPERRVREAVTVATPRQVLIEVAVAIAGVGFSLGRAALLSAAIAEDIV